MTLLRASFISTHQRSSFWDGRTKYTENELSDFPLRAMRDWQHKVGLNIFEIINRKKKTLRFAGQTNKQTNKDKEKQRNDESEFLTTGFISKYNTHDLYDNVFILTHFQGLSVKLP